jgi:predicted transcriptional regulator
MKLEQIIKKLNRMRRAERIEVAITAGISLRHIDRLRNGTSGPRHSTYLRLAELLKGR